MIRVTLKNYFNLLLENSLLEENLYKRIIENNNLLKEIIKKKEFKKTWHNKLGYSFQNEKYKITNMKIYKEGRIIKVLVTVLHSFILNNVPSKTISTEKLNYIFILKRYNGKYKIINSCCKEEFPNNYDYLINHNIMENNDRSKFIYEDRYQFWNYNLKRINTLIKFIEKFQIIYRTSYDDEAIEVSIRNNLKYNPFESVKYAKKYALTYNKEYRSFNDMGGDCTNFVSQCLHFGGINYTNLWKPYTNSWIRVSELYNFFTKKGYGKEVSSSQLFTLGSVIQFYSNQKGYYSHSGLITEVLANGDYLYCCHSYDKLNFPLSEIYPLFYDKFRVIEIYK